MSVVLKPLATGKRITAVHKARAACTLAALTLLATSALAQTPETAAPAASQPAAQQTQPQAAQTPPAAPAAAQAPQSGTAPAPAQPANGGTVSQSQAPASQPATPAPAPAPANAAPVAAEQAPASSAPASSVPNAAAPVNPIQPELPAAPAAAPGPSGERADIPHNLSPWGMFMAADWVVKGVMGGLAFASLVTWTIWLAKTLELAGARARAGRLIRIIREARTLPEALETAGNRGGPAALMLRAAAEEVHMSHAAIDHAGGEGVKERVSSVLSRIEAHSGRRMARGTGVLATIGSVAPFVGLFGTVWGIMNSFIGISQSHTTNLAVVAPGIAEALLATAIGLVAAIPAVVIYNVFARSVTGYRHLLGDAAAGVERLVSRDLDFRKAPPGSRKAAPVSLVSGG